MLSLHRVQLVAYFRHILADVEAVSIILASPLCVLNLASVFVSHHHREQLAVRIRLRQISQQLHDALVSEQR